MPRPSPVTDEVQRQLASGRRHAWTLAELLEAVRSTYPRANYSSVFRAMSTLEHAGAVERFDLGDGASRYELSGAHHEHVRCESCGRVAVITGCVAEDAPARIESDTGYHVSSHQVVFVGLCPDCARAASASGHTRHLNHPHRHGDGCGHLGVPHGDHVDYVHGGHRHAAHGDHWDEH